MPSRERFVQLDFSGGYNSKDVPRAVGGKACQELVNLYPGESPRPREGCPDWSREEWPGAVYELIPWGSVDGNKLIAWTSEGFYWNRKGSTAPVYIGAGPRRGASICWQRIEGALIIGSTTGWSAIIEWDDSSKTFAMRNANIKMPAGAHMELSTGSIGGSLTPEKWYSYAFTLVNCPERAGKTVTEGFLPGKLESWEDLDRRQTFHAPASCTSIFLEFFFGGAILDPQVTHIRLYRTQPQDEESIAKGYTHGWIADIAYTPGSSPSFLDKVAGAESDNAPATSGLAEMPACRSMAFIGGRLWINGAFGGSPGRWWYSSGILDAVGYLKHLTMFALNTDFKDCSLDDSQRATGAMVVGNDLYFFNERSIFRIADGDPDAKPEIVSSKIGCRFPRTLTQGDTWGLFLSDYGPRMIQGASIDEVPFLAGEVWPNSHEGGSILKAEPDKVVGFWYKQTWWIAGGGKVVGWHENGGKRGAMSIQFAAESVGIERVAVFSEEEAAIHSWRSRRSFWFLNSSTWTDDGYWTTLKVKASRFFVDPSDPARMGEPYDARIHCSYTDNGNLKIRLEGDGARIRRLFTYQARPLSATLQPQDVASATTFSYQQPIPAGLRSGFFDLTIEKMLRPPFDFVLSGMELRVIPRRSRPNDSLSVDLGVDEPLDKGLSPADVGDTVGQ